MILLPRLDRVEIRLVASHLNSKRPAGCEVAREISEKLSLRAGWNSSGGTRVPDSERNRFAEQLRSLAREHGYPEYPDISQQQGFDRSACRVLEHERLLNSASGETLRAECWAGLTVLDLLDLAVWRHATPAKESQFISVDRLLGGNRNFLRRLWLRNQCLSLDDAEGAQRWLLVDGMNEDAFVAIVERPSIAADNRLARTVGLVWLERNNAGIHMQPVMRIATRSIRALAETRMISALSDDQLLELVSAAFDRAQALEAGDVDSTMKPAQDQSRGNSLSRLADALFGR